MSIVGPMQWTVLAAFCLQISIIWASTPNCIDSKDVNASGDYDPEGDGGVASFSVVCDGEFVVVHHNREGRTFVNDYAPWGYIAPMDYSSNGISVTLDQVRALVKRATSCSYYIETECTYVYFHEDTHWVAYNDEVVKWYNTAGTFCEYTSRSCNCHETDGGTDEGYLQDIRRFPIKTLVFGDTDQSYESMNYTVGPLKCKMAMTLRPAAGFCLETSMRDQVDFECDVTAYPYVTVIHHDREQRTFVNDYESVGSFSAPLTYQSFSGDRTFNIDDVYEVVKLATFCEYHLTVECHGSSLIDGWMTPYNTTIPSVSYAQTTGTLCTSENNGERVCECDISNDGDSGYIRYLQYFPIRDLRFGDTGGSDEWLYYTLGPLRCIINQKMSK